MEKIIYIIILLIVIMIILMMYNRHKLLSIGKHFCIKLSPITSIENIKKEYQIIEEKKPIYIFYHICTQNNWKEIIDEQMEEVISSGLYDKVEKIYFGCNCCNCDILLPEYFMKYDKIEKLDDAIFPNDKSYENNTINSMIRFSKSNPKCHIFYMHTKGITNAFDTQSIWRKYMMNSLVSHHEYCIELLRRGFYTVGTRYTNYFPLVRKLFNNLKPIFGFLNHIGMMRSSTLNSYYAGNFFWASGEYISRLDYIKNVSDRYMAELSLLTKIEQGKHANINDDGLGDESDMETFKIHHTDNPHISIF